MPFSTELFIVKRLIASTAKGDSNQLKGVSVIVKIALTSVILSVAVLQLSFGVIHGFKQEIKNKIGSLGAHIVVKHYNQLGAFEQTPINAQQDFLEELKAYPKVQHVQQFAYKAGILKNNTTIEGIVAKGVSSDFNATWFQQYLVEGTIPKFNIDSITPEVLLSTKQATKLNLKVGDKVLLYFIHNNKARPRKLQVASLYKTGIAKIDESVVVLDLAIIQKINQWEPDQVGGYEIYLNDVNELEEADAFIYQNIDQTYITRTIQEDNQELFGWLELLDTNVVVLLVILLLVAGINAISTLLILILNRTQMVGMLMAMGMANGKIQRVFLLLGTYLFASGVMIGSVIALVLGSTQNYFKLITLNEESYYLSYVPVDFTWWVVALVAAGSIAVGMLFVAIPIQYLKRLSPVKILRFI